MVLSVLVHVYFCSIHALNCKFPISRLLFIYLLILFISRPFIYLPPPPGPTFSHPRRGRCHRDIYNKIAHSTETMEKTVKNKHLSKWKLICTESKNCCKSVLFRPKFGLESHGLRCIWYPPNKNLPLCMFYWYLHLWFDYVIKKKTKKPRENQKTQRKTIFQDSCKSKNPKIKKTSRKPKKTKKTKKTIFQDSCKSKNAKIQKTSRKPKKPKKTKKTIFQKFGDGVYRQEFWNIVFFVFFGFFGFLEVFLIFAFFLFQESWNIVFFCFFGFFAFLEVFLIFAFFLFQESWNIGFFGFFGFFGFLEVFWVRFFMMKMHYILDDVY